LPYLPYLPVYGVPFLSAHSQPIIPSLESFGPLHAHGRNARQVLPYEFTKLGISMWVQMVYIDWVHLDLTDCMPRPTVDSAHRPATASGRELDLTNNKPRYYQTPHKENLISPIYMVDDRSSVFHFLSLLNRIHHHHRTSHSESKNSLHTNKTFTS